MLGHKWLGDPSPKLVTHVGRILHMRDEVPKIRPIRKMSESYLEGPASSRIANVRQINMPEKPNLHLMLWCKPRTVAPRWVTMPKTVDIVFIETDASWVHYPHEDAIVITTKITNSLIHWVLIDSGSAVNILH